MSVGLAALVKQWFRLDQNETTRSEIQKLWDHPTYENVEELRERMEKRIAFGTAGERHDGPRL
jgi:phosphoglucomutase